MGTANRSDTSTTSKCLEILYLKVQLLALDVTQIIIAEHIFLTLCGLV